MAAISGHPTFTGWGTAFRKVRDRRSHNCIWPRGTDNDILGKEPLTAISFPTAIGLCGSTTPKCTLSRRPCALQCQRIETWTRIGSLRMASKNYPIPHLRPKVAPILRLQNEINRSRSLGHALRLSFRPTDHGCLGNIVRFLTPCFKRMASSL